MSAATEMTDAEFDVMLRVRSAEPQVRTLMPLLYRLFEGDCYDEDEDGFRWLVIDATRIVDFVAEGRSVLDALEDSGRWSEGVTEPTEIVAAIEAHLSTTSEVPK